MLKKKEKYFVANENENDPFVENENENHFVDENENENYFVDENVNHFEVENGNENENLECDVEFNENTFLKLGSGVLDNLLGQISWRKIRTHANRIYTKFFYRKKIAFQCQLMMQLMRMQKIRK